MNWFVRRHADAIAFLRRAGGWLAASEAEHNLVLSIAGGLTRNAPPAPPYLATIEADGRVYGCAIRTPPYKLVIGRVPAEATDAAVADVADVFPELDRIHGPVDDARRFAERWCSRTGATPRARTSLGLYELDAVIRPEPHAPGRLRAATAADTDLVGDWAESFVAESTTDVGRARTMVETGIARRAIFIWEDGQPVSVAACVGETPTGRRIGLVYTPPELRRRGYAAACVADLSQRVLDAGARRCFLYTDLGNPTSNGVYRRIGYRLIGEAVDYDIS